MPKKKKEPSETTLAKQATINVELARSKVRRKAAEQERRDFQSLPFREQQGRIRAGVKTGKVARSDEFKEPRKIGEAITSESLERGFPEEPLTKEAVQERLSNLKFLDLQRIQKIFEEEGIFAALSEMISPTEFQGQPIAAGTVPLAFGAGQVGLLSRAITGIGEVQKGASAITTTTYLKGGSSVIERYVDGVVVQRSFVGKTLTAAIDKIPAGARATTTRFATNVKSLSLSKKLLIGAGLTIGAASLLINVIGTYPFSGFIQEEASQTTSIGFFQAQKAGDIQGMQDAITRQEEILNAAPSILDKIPYANVQKQLREYFISVAVKLESDKRILAKKRAELE